MYATFLAYYRTNVGLPSLVIGMPVFRGGRRGSHYSSKRWGVEGVVVVWCVFLLI